MADLGAEGTWKITIEGMKNSETWKAVRGSWDGNKKDNRCSGCGVVIQAVDRDSWVATSNNCSTTEGKARPWPRTNCWCTRSDCTFGSFFFCEENEYADGDQLYEASCG